MISLIILNDYTTKNPEVFDFQSKNIKKLFDFSIHPPITGIESGTSARNRNEHAKRTAVLQTGPAWPTILSNQRGSFQTFVTICPSLVTCVSLEVKRCYSNCPCNAHLNCHEVASRYWEIWGCRARDRGADRPQKAWPVLFPEFSKIQKKQWPTVRVFQPHPPDWFYQTMTKFSSFKCISCPLRCAGRSNVWGRPTFPTLKLNNPR